jgi:hypothetical protein
MGRRRRGAPRLWRLDGTPTGRADNTTGARRGEGRPWCSLRVGGVDVAGLAWVAARRRCTRRRSFLCSGPAPPRPRTAPPLSSGSTRTRPSAAATRRRRRALVPRLASSPPLPPSSPPSDGGSGKGQKTPMRVGGEANCYWLSYPAFESAASRGHGELPRLPRLGPTGGCGGASHIPLSAPRARPRRGGK